MHHYDYTLSSVCVFPPLSFFLFNNSIALIFLLLRMIFPMYQTALSLLVQKTFACGYGNSATVCSFLPMCYLRKIAARLCGLFRKKCYLCR